GLKAIGYALGHGGNPANAPFRFVALAGGYNVAHAQFADAPEFGAIRARWEKALQGFKVRRLGNGEVTNKTLVEAVAVLELRRSGFLSDSGHALALVDRLLATDLPRAARTTARGKTVLIGDFSGAPLAYHALATGFLARAVELLGSSAPAAGRRVLRRAVEASWEFAGPDGDVSYYGRSQEQAWTLPLTAYAAARLGGGRYLALSARTVDRLDRAYRVGSGGLFVTPALAQDVDAAIAGLDPYVAAVSYNGLTLVALDWAIGATAGPGGGKVGADSDGSHRFASGPRSFATVRHGNVWFAVKQAKSDPKDLRYDFGLIALKVRDDTGLWRTMPLRPLIAGARETAGPVLGGGGLPVGSTLSVAGDGTVTVDGGFRTAAGRWLRRGVKFRFTPGKCGVRMTVPARRGDDFDYSAFVNRSPSVEPFSLEDDKQVVAVLPRNRTSAAGRSASGLNAVVVRRRFRLRGVHSARISVTTCSKYRGPPERNSSAKAASGAVADDLKLPLPAWQRSGSVRLRNSGGRYGRSLQLSGSGRISRALPANLGAVSLDVKLPRGAALAVGVGSRRRALSGPAGWRRLEFAGKLAGPLTLRPTRGAPEVRALVATRRGDRGALLLHRLAALHTQTRLGRYPYGSGPGPRGKLRFSDDWTTGFWPGSLWRAYDLTKSRLFRDWALATTLRHTGNERDAMHDQGFRYLESSAAAYDRLCTTAASTACHRLRASALKAADTLLALQRTNPGSGTLPTVPKGCGDCASGKEGETLIDSIMNAGLIEWAYAQTGAAKYRDAALKHARGVAKLLVRADGSTAQAVRLNRRTGRVIKVHTHQGRSASSTWARGQAWAVYGFAQTGAALDDPDLIAISERAAQYVAGHLPASAVPPYDYSAPSGRPLDTSAGVITAAGLFRLADACDATPGACAQAGRWRPLARRMLDASLRHVSAKPPLGFLGDEVLTKGGEARWDDRAELIFGIDYALEGVNRAG
ncbi:MAG: unsaturated chondroitin disaccharide hydrolase, partial [Thermoleophilaceae bacterium]|nr:unsaturated chondroitin disaccharide hydrolase [Thermoleophilaceae bacterium]